MIASEWIWVVFETQQDIGSFGPSITNNNPFISLFTVALSYLSGTLELPAPSMHHAYSTTGDHRREFLCCLYEWHLPPLPGHWTTFQPQFMHTHNMTNITHMHRWFHDAHDSDTPEPTQP